MSNTNNNWLCPNCGESNSETHVFCTACATKKPNQNADSPDSAQSESVSLFEENLPHQESTNFDAKEKDAEPTGVAGRSWDKDLFADYGFETRTDETQPEEATLEEKENFDSEITVSKMRGLKDFLNNRRNRSIILLALAAVMLLLVFTPFIKISVPYGNSEYAVSLTPLEFVDFTADSFLSYNSNKLQKTQEYQSYSDLARKLENIAVGSSLTRSQKRILEDYTKNALALQLMSVDTDTKFNLILSSIFAFAYIALTVFTLLFATIALIAVLRSKEMIAESALMRANRSTVLFISFIPVYMFTLLQAGHFNFGVFGNTFSSSNVTLGWGGIMVFLLSCMILAYIIWQCVDSFLTEIKIKADITSYAKITASALALFAVISMFLPCVSVGFAANSGRHGEIETKTYWVDSTDIYEMSQNDASYYTFVSDSMDEKGIIEIADMAASKSKSIDKQIGNRMLNVMLFRYGDDIKALCTIMSIVELLALAMSVLLSKNILGAVLKRELPKNQNRLQVAAIVFAVIYLALSISVCAVANSNLSFETAKSLVFSVGAGPIMLTVCTIAIAVCTRVRHIDKTSAEYDNPDVSYAPYVI